MVLETWVQFQVESYQRLKKWYLTPPCLTLIIIKYRSRVMWSNPGKEVPSHTLCCSGYWKGSLLVAFDYGCQQQQQQLYIYIYCMCVWSWAERKSEHANIYLSHKVFVHLPRDLLEHIENKRVRQKTLKWLSDSDTVEKYKIYSPTVNEARITQED